MPKALDFPEMRRSLALAAIALCAPLALVACTPASLVDRAVPTTTTPSISAPAPEPEPTVVGTPADVANPGPCDAVAPRVPVDDGEVEQLGGWSLITPIDLGPRPFANGEVRSDANGTPVAYVVSSNDTVEAIGARFCIGAQWLYAINSVRREGNDLYVGDILNLDAHTILSVGDQNGVVHDNPPIITPIPPQH